MNLSAQIPILSRVSFLDKLLFTKHLAMMIKSGITILEALDILATQTKSRAFKNVLESVVRDIRNGKSLSDSLAKHPQTFDTFYTSIIEIGETSGTLDESFLYLSQQLAKEYSFRKKIQGAMMYPSIVFVAASVVGIGISLFVLPKLIALFEGFDVQLPITTQILLFIAGAMQQYGVIIVIWFLLLVVFFRFVITIPVVKPLWQNILFSIPIFGKILVNAQLTSFCRNLGIMLKSGLPITRALEVEAKMTSNAIFKRYLTRMLHAIDTGKSFAAELETGAYPRIPLIVTKMIAVGERTGKLEETFLYLGDFFEDEVDDATRNISTVLEPIMLLVIGGIVAFVALAVISPIYDLTSSIKR